MFLLECVEASETLHEEFVAVLVDSYEGHDGGGHSFVLCSSGASRSDRGSR